MVGRIGLPGYKEAGDEANDECACAGGDHSGGELLRAVATLLQHTRNACMKGHSSSNTPAKLRLYKATMSTHAQEVITAPPLCCSEPPSMYFQVAHLQTGKKYRDGSHRDNFGRNLETLSVVKSQYSGFLSRLYIF